MYEGFYLQVAVNGKIGRKVFLEVKPTERNMLKYAILASAVMISAPVLAQDKPADSQTAPTTQAAPTQTAPESTPATPDTASPVDQAMSSVTPTADQAAPAQTAAQPASKADQIAQVVSTEFPTYDKDANGSLNETEFGSWMVALKTASDPTTKAESAATKSWVDQAFASADTDKNKALSKTELTGFLTQGS
jgi:hypothetical protein